EPCTRSGSTSACTSMSVRLAPQRAGRIEQWHQIPVRGESQRLQLQRVQARRPAGAQIGDAQAVAVALSVDLDAYRGVLVGHRHPRPSPVAADPTADNLPGDRREPVDRVLTVTRHTVPAKRQNGWPAGSSSTRTSSWGWWSASRAPASTAHPTAASRSDTAM